MSCCSPSSAPIGATTPSLIAGNSKEFGIHPRIARRRTAHGSGLGTKRWVAERTLSWLHQLKKLQIRQERQ
jgi:transposase